MRVPMAMSGVALLVAAGLLLPPVALAQAPPLLPMEEEEPAPVSGPKADAQPVEAASSRSEASSNPTREHSTRPQTFMEEFELDESEIVLSAGKKHTTIQEAPGIIHVVTGDTIRAYGMRTINDILTMVPGFEGDRFGSNGWSREPIIRGNPRTLLVLWNGVPLNEPSRNLAVLDRKIPVDIVDRVEVSSGPGGVLWGSNALLGVLNIITRDAESLRADAPANRDPELPHLEVGLGGGGGPGEQEALQGSLSMAQSFWDNRVRIFSNAHFFSSNGALLEVDHRKVLGVLPAPEPDGPTFWETDPETGAYVSGETDGNERDRFFLWSGRLSVASFSFDWMLPFEEDRRQIATGGALLVDGDTSRDLRKRLETTSSDRIRLLSLGYRERFFEDSLGISLKGYLLTWDLNEVPFGVFPPSAALPQGQAIELIGEDAQRRTGFNLDSDLRLSDHHLIFGGEFFLETIEGLNSAAWDLGCERARQATGDAQHSFDDVPYRSGDEACVFEEPIVFDSSRKVGAVFLTDEWHLLPSLVLFGGGRLQLSDSYDATPLLSAAVVYNPWSRLFLKLNYSDGLRPPYFTATQVNSQAHSGVTYQANEDLGVERSQSIDSELNLTLLEGGPWVDKLFFRANYGYTRLLDLIGNPGGRFQNTGSRGIHALQLRAQLTLLGAHELWGGYTFLEVQDSETGPVRNIANQVAQGGVVLRFLDRQLELTSLATWVGPREDLNRDPSQGVPGDALIPGTRYVQPTALVVDELDAYLLWRAGLRVRRLFDAFDLSFYLYDLANLLGAPPRQDPDLFFDDRVLTRPQPREGWSFFVKLEGRL